MGKLHERRLSSDIWLKTLPVAASEPLESVYRSRGRFETRSSFSVKHQCRSDHPGLVSLPPLKSQLKFKRTAVT